MPPVETGTTNRQPDQIRRNSRVQPLTLHAFGMLFVGPMQRLISRALAVCRSIA